MQWYHLLSCIFKYKINSPVQAKETPFWFAFSKKLCNIYIFLNNTPEKDMLFVSYIYKLQMNNYPRISNRWSLLLMRNSLLFLLAWKWIHVRKFLNGKNGYKWYICRIYTVQCWNIYFLKVHILSFPCTYKYFLLWRLKHNNNCFMLN